MAKRVTKFDAFLGIPVERDLKRRISRIAKNEERNPTEMARLLLRDGADRWEENHQAGVGEELTAATAK